YLVELADLHLQQRTRLAVERRLPELVLVHFSEALVALEGHALAPRRVDRLEQVRRAGDRGLLAAAGKDGGSGEGFAQGARMLVEPARVGRSEQACIEGRRLADAAHLARQDVASGLDPAAPAALGLFGDRVHANRERVRALFALRLVVGAQSAERRAPPVRLRFCCSANAGRSRD